MTAPTPDTKKKSRSKTKRSVLLPTSVLLVIIVAGGALFLFQQKDPLIFSAAKTAVMETVEKTVADITEKFPQQSAVPEERPSLPEERPHEQPPPREQPLLQKEKMFAESVPEPESDPETRAVETLNIFYQNLDSREYMTAFSLQVPSREHFSSLIQKLLDNPPVVVRETDDLYTLLKNTAHFFRILGQENVLMLKGILDREKDSLEEILRSFYLLAHTPDRLQKEFSIHLDNEALYDYAAFFLNTMGGRLYLFRRDATSRMIVTYYAVLVIDEANDTHNSPHGIDISPPLSSLVDEMENGGNGLRYREEYLEKLYLLQEKYQR